MLTVSIVSHGHRGLIGALLDDLRAASRSLPLEVLLTENIPENLHELLPGSGPLFQIITNDKPKGFAENHNSAFRLAQGEFFCVLNPDTRITAAMLKSLCRVASERGGIAGPIVVDPAGSCEDSARLVPTIGRLIIRRFGDRRPDYDVPQGIVSVDWLAGMCLVMSRQLFAKLKGFDTRYWLYCEDVDICLRAHLHGAGVWWVGEARLTHDARRNSHRSIRFAMLHLTSMARLFSSHAYWRFWKLARSR